jgi:hypothetical protein
MIPTRGAASIAAIALAMLAACVDTSPIDYVAPDLRDGATEGGNDASSMDAGLVAACKECITQGACKSQYQGCLKNQKCGFETACLVDAYCLNFSLTDIANLPACVNNCAADAGVTGQSDPAVLAFAPLIVCAQSATGCAAVCDVGTSP